MVLNLNINANEINKEGNIVTFDYNNHKVRTIINDAETWWFLKDVCDVLGISNPRVAASRLDNDEKGVSSTYILGGTQNMTMINESGLYEIVLRSEKLEAKRFQRWVTHEVLPSLRKHGAYMTDDVQEYNMPTQRAMNLKLFTIKEAAITHSDERIMTSLTPKVTGKGQVYFVNHFKKSFIQQRSESSANLK